jgi:RNA polymerase sigma-70 factor, ECF subfamily
MRSRDGRMSAPAAKMAICQEPATLRGSPRNIVATILGARPCRSWHDAKNALSLAFLRFRVAELRGTAIAIGAFNMNTTAKFAVNVESSVTTPDDWVEAHGDYLFNFAIGQLRDASVAEDLMQDTFLAAFKARGGFSAMSSERTWLVGILRHKIYDHLRHACRERAVRVDTAPIQCDEEAWGDAVLWLHDVAAECAQPSRRLELAEFRANLEAALGKLPPRVAQVFQLYEVEERPNSEVCQRLNISESNLWVMLHRARKQLRGQLADWWNGDSNDQRSNKLNT